MVKGLSPKEEIRRDHFMVDMQEFIYALDDSYIQANMQAALDKMLAAEKRIGPAPEPIPWHKRPIAIWDKETADLFYAADENIQKAWNEYAQAEANVFNSQGDPDRQTGTIYQWTPPLSFPEWQRRHSDAKAG